MIFNEQSVFLQFVTITNYFSKIIWSDPKTGQGLFLLETNTKKMDYDLPKKFMTAYLYHQNRNQTYARKRM